jgi:IS30 family transposase
MGRRASTISRELKRNSLPKGGSKAAIAVRMAWFRRRRRSRLERLSPLGDLVRDGLAMDWSTRRSSRIPSSDARAAHRLVSDRRRDNPITRGHIIKAVPDRSAAEGQPC